MRQLSYNHTHGISNELPPVSKQEEFGHNNIRGMIGVNKSTEALGSALQQLQLRVNAWSQHLHGHSHQR